MWTRDLSHVASAALGAYAFSEIAARVVGDAVAPDTARLLTLVALAVEHGVGLHEQLART